MRRFLIRLLPVAALAGIAPALAQVSPFSMGSGGPAQAPAPARPFSPSAEAPPPQPPSAPFDMKTGAGAPAPQANAPAQPARPFSPAAAAPPPATGTASPGSPFSMGPQGGRPPEPPRVGTVPPGSGTRTMPAAPPASASAPAPARGSGRNERPILPADDVRLEGEVDARSWAIHLTQDEAAGNVSLSVGYQNAVVVMPEVSRLRVMINGETAMDVPIASSQEVRRVVVPIRAGLLRTGQNTIRMEATQRHRIDCTVRATYELWTDLDARTTGLVFAEGTPRFLRGLEDLPAVGTDPTGATTIRVIAPRVYRPEIRDRLLRLVQMVALRGRYAHPVVKVFEADPGPAPAGTLKVFLGVASELRSIMPNPPDAAMTQALALVAQDGGAPALIISGPSWQDLDTAINVVAASMLNNRPAERTSIDTASWNWPDVPRYQGERAVKLGDMGVPTQEFSGRRFRVRFAIDLPADFYASYYGEATLYLDAAYTPAVRPGSHIDIYVNDKISSTMRITSKGEIYRRHPIRIPMRNFRPGINTVSFEAVLLTDADERCPPGGTLSEASRFALFDSTELAIPNFGRIGRLPDLAEVSAAGFPLSAAPATFVLARQNPTLYSAAGTLLARMARDAGEPVRAQFANAPAVGDPSTVLIGAIDQLATGMLARVGVSERTRTLWQAAPVPPRPNGPMVVNPDGSRAMADASGMSADVGVFADPGQQGSTDDVRRRWTESLSRRSFLQSRIESVKAWVERTFSLSISSLSFSSARQELYEPPSRATLLLAQGSSDGDGTWTVLTARSEDALADETARLTSPGLWSEVAGHVVTLDPDQDKVEAQSIGPFTFVQTQPFSFRNLRLVAANWMSINILQYAVLLVACCTVLGAATFFLLNRLGRRS